MDRRLTSLVSPSPLRAEYKNDRELIPRSTSVIARRLPPARGPGRGNALDYMASNEDSGAGSNAMAGRGAAPTPRGGVGGFNKDMYTKRFDGREDVGGPSAAPQVRSAFLLSRELSLSVLGATPRAFRNQTSHVGLVPSLLPAPSLLSFSLSRSVCDRIRPRCRSPSRPPATRRPPWLPCLQRRARNGSRRRSRCRSASSRFPHLLVFTGSLCTGVNGLVST